MTPLAKILVQNFTGLNCEDIDEENIYFIFGYKFLLT